MRIAILAGGSSSRFGSDKALFKTRGMTLLEHVTEAAVSTGYETFIVGRSAPPPGWMRKSIDFVPDEEPGQGPIGGLVTALRAAEDEVLLCACDMPLLNAAAFQWLGDMTRIDGSMGIITTNGGRLEPLFSRYGPECLEAAKVLADYGDSSMQALIEQKAFNRAEAPDWLRPLLLNVNTPEELNSV